MTSCPVAELCYSLRVFQHAPPPPPDNQAEVASNADTLSESASRTRTASVAAQAALESRLAAETNILPEEDSCPFALTQCQAIYDGALRRSVRDLHVNDGSFGLSTFLRETDGHTDLERAQRVNADLQERLSLQNSVPARVASLHLILATPQLHVGPLTPLAFEGWHQRPLTERMMILEAHRVYPPPNSALPMLVDLATRAGSELALRQKIVESLGHAATATELMTVVASIKRDHPTSHGLAFRFGAALGRCGAACAPTVANLLTSPHAQDRDAAYRAVARANGTLGHLASSVRVDIVEGHESLLVARAFGPDWRDVQ